MVRKRIIPKFLLRNGRLVKGVRFHEQLREGGNPVSTARIYDSYGVDELIFLDIAASTTNQATVAEVIDLVSRDVFMPFTAGGGVRTIEDINRLLRAGADKVAINTAAVENSSLLRDAAQTFGNQCLTVAIDYREVAPGVRRVFVRGGTVATTLDPLEWALRVQDAHCGEVLLCSIDRDGTLEGYDLDFASSVSAALDVPMIVSSGAGSLQHCLDALQTEISGIAISSLFLFTDHSPIKVRSFLRSRGIDVRANSSSRN
jgi:imidazole glycerol-phosphate synthase subunit HisF